jgi:hypothetical protein
MTSSYKRRALICTTSENETRKIDQTDVKTTSLMKLSDDILVHRIMCYLEWEIGAPGCYTPYSLNRYWYLITRRCKSISTTKTLRIVGGPVRGHCYQPICKNVKKMMDMFDINIVKWEIQYNRVGVSVNYGLLNEPTSVIAWVIERSKFPVLVFDTKYSIMNDVLGCIMGTERVSKLHTLIFNNNYMTESDQLKTFTVERLPALQNIKYPEDMIPHSHHHHEVRVAQERLFELRPEITLNNVRSIKCAIIDCYRLIPNLPHCKAGFHNGKGEIEHYCDRIIDVCIQHSMNFRRYIDRRSVKCNTPDCTNRIHPTCVTSRYKKCNMITCPPICVMYPNGPCFDCDKYSEKAWKLMYYCIDCMQQSIPCRDYGQHCCTNRTTRKCKNCGLRTCLSHNMSVDSNNRPQKCLDCSRLIGQCKKCNRRACMSSIGFNDITDCAYPITTSADIDKIDDMIKTC